MVEIPAAPVVSAKDRADNPPAFRRHEAQAPVAPKEVRDGGPGVGLVEAHAGHARPQRMNCGEVAQDERAQVNLS
jgi:hypothetical protein